MQIASRIRRLRLEQFLSLETLAAKAGFSPSLLARFENGQEVPQLEVFDRLAEALAVPLQGLFYGGTDSILTPYLTPRPSLQQLIAESTYFALDPDALPDQAQAEPESPSDSPPSEPTDP